MSSRDTAGGIIVRKDGKIVLVWQNKNSWSFPKGGVEEGETLLAAAMREIWEETGLKDLQLIVELGSYKRHPIANNGIGENTAVPPSTKTLFLFTTEQTDLVPQDVEVTEARWVSVDEALALLTHPKDKEFLESVRDKIVA